MTSLTGSKLPIARHCKWWLRPDVKYPERPRSGAATDGSRLHEYAADLVDTGEHPPCSSADELVMRGVRDFWKGRHGQGWQAEVALGLDAALGEARVVGKRIDRNYPEPRTPGEIFLSVDYIGEVPELVTVGDWKTGYASHVEPPDDNLQLLAGGAAAMLALKKKDGAVLEIAHATEDGVFPRRYVASPLTLYRAMSEIALIQAGVEGARAKAGDHCRYCPALGACPETGTMVRQFSQAKVEWTTEFVSEENDRLLVEELSAVKKMIDAIEDAVKKRASERGGILLSDGKIYKAILSYRSSLNKAKVEKLLGPRYAECVETVSYEQFRRVKA